MGGAVPYYNADPSQQQPTPQGVPQAAPPASAPAQQATAGPAPDPSPTPTPQQPSQQAPAGSQSAPAASPVSANPATGGGTGMLHGILKALDGTQDTAYQVNPQTGQLMQSQIASGPGSMAKRIIAGAVTGLAAGSSAAPGPGHTLRGLGLGIQAGQQRVQEQDQQKRQQATQDYELAQKSKLQNAQMALLNQNITRGAFDLSRAKITAATQDSDAENDVAKQIANDPHGKDLGVVTEGNGMDHTQALTAFLKAHPEEIAAHARGEVMSVPHINAAGQVDGTHFFQVSPDFKAQKTTEPTTIRRLVPGKADNDPGRWDVQTLPAGMTNGDVMAAQMGVADANNTTRLSEYKEQQETQRSAASNATSRADAQTSASAELQKARIMSGFGDPGQQGAGGGGADGKGNSVDQAAELMLAGKEAPSQLPKRQGQNQIIMNRTQQLAQQRGVEWSPEVAEENYKANTKMLNDYIGGRTRDQLTSFNTFLGHAQAASKLVDQLRNTRSPVLNTPLNAIRTAAGSPEASILAEYKTEMAAATKEWSSLINNGFALDKADSDLAGKLSSENNSPAVAQSVMKGMASTGAIRLGSVNAAYVRGPGRAAGSHAASNAPGLLTQQGAQALQNFGIDPRSVYVQPTDDYNPTAQRSQQQPQQQATPQTHVFNAATWAQANPGKDVNAAIAQAKQQGFQVKQ